MEMIFFWINAVTIGSLLLTIIYTAGVIWRVEMKLDISYKFFLVSIIFFLAAEIVDLYYPVKNSIAFEIAVKILRMLFALGFFGGVLFMRNAIRCLDGEKTSKTKNASGI